MAEEEEDEEGEKPRIRILDDPQVVAGRPRRWLQCPREEARVDC